MVSKSISGKGALSKSSYKIQANVEAYASFVVRSLVDIKGRSESDVVAFIVKDWIGDHREELNEYGINVASWRTGK